jgi:DNA sulfur modification protein DndD
MIIEAIDLENFGPYYGEHSLNLAGGIPVVVVVEGDNMAGKTTLLNAVRWNFYAKAKGRDGQAMNVADLLNSDAKAENDLRFSVRVTVLDDGRRIVLFRQLKAKPHVLNPTSASDFDDYKSVEIDGAFRNPDEYEGIVEDLLPDSISRFFLFDGELLNEYEALVREGGKQGAAAVRESIEMILGLPAARNARDDMQALKEDLGRRLARANTQDKRYRAAAADHDRLSAEKDQLNRDRTEILAQITVSREELDALEMELLLYQESKEEAGRLRAERKRLAELQNDLTRKQDERRILASDLWRDVLTPRLKAETARMEEERDQRSTAIARMAQIAAETARLAADVDQATCSECGRSIEADERERILASVQKLQGEAQALEEAADVERFENLTSVLRQLRKVAPAGIVAAMKAAEIDIQQIHVNIYRSEEEIKRSERKLRDVPTDEIERWDQRSRELRSGIADRQTKVQQLDSRIEEVEMLIARAKRKLLDNENPASQRLAREHDVIEVLEDLTKKAVDELTAELRRDVEAEASDIFRQLTTDPRYERLSINEQFGLTIVRDDGEEVKVRSAGAEQVVALSLIGALNRLAQKRGPVIMDTPFGRLDRGHRRNIIRFLPTMADQVVLLVHDGEMDLERDLEPILDALTSRYKIDRDGTKSAIVKVEAPVHV